MADLPVAECQEAGRFILQNAKSQLIDIKATRQGPQGRAASNIYIDDRVIVDGVLDARRMRPVARFGYMDYCVVDDVFTMQRV
jgi:hypothetical protein